MDYISTRGDGPVSFETACLSGLARDGGLYTPTDYPRVGQADAAQPYVDVATRVLSAFAGSDAEVEDVRAIAEKAYATFAHARVAPLVELADDRWMMELHHGPTLAFKDVAMQAIAGFYDLFLQRRGVRLTVLCATSGDTGGAAAAAFAGSANVDLFILHP